MVYSWISLSFLSQGTGGSEMRYACKIDVAVSVAVVIVERPGGSASSALYCMYLCI